VGFFPIHFSVITRALIGQKGELELKTKYGLRKMATGSDESEFAEFNSSQVRKELKSDRQKLKRKETFSGKGKVIRYSDGVRHNKRSKGERSVVVNERNETENVIENQNIFQENVQETQGNAIRLIVLLIKCIDHEFLSRSEQPAY
jgi:hypothetical protein